MIGEDIWGGENTVGARKTSATAVGLTSICTLLILAPGAHSAVGLEQPSDPDYVRYVSATAVALLDEIGAAISNFFSWFLTQKITFQVQSIGALTAASSIASNFSALKSVWSSMTTCENLLDFRGLKIGQSLDFQAPMRALLLSFALFVSYQLLSHVSGYVVAPSWSTYLLDAGVQVLLFCLLAVQFLRIWLMASTRWETDDKKQRRFWRTFNAALAKKGIGFMSVAGSVAILPVAAISPKAVELWTLQEPNLMRLVSGWL